MTYVFAGQYGPQTLVTVTAGVVSPLPSISVAVYAVGTTTPIQLYTSRTMATQAANPTMTDANGNLTFFCAPGEVDILGNSQRQTVVVNPDPADVATVDGVTLTGPLVLAADPTTNLQAATKHYVDTTSGGGGAPLNSPAFTGVPTAPTAAPGTNDTQLATTNYADLSAFAETIRATTAEALLRMTITAVKTANYTLAAGEYVPVNDTAGIVALTLPTAPADGTRCGAEYVAGGSHGVVTTAGGGDVFEVAGGSTTSTLAVGALFQSTLWQYSHAAGIWYTVSNLNLPLSFFDGRYPRAQSDTFSVPTPTTGVAFTPNGFGLSFLGITCTTSTSIKVTYGPTTGAENTWVPTVTAPVGAFYFLVVPQSYKVIVTGTIADFSFVSNTPL